MTHSSQPLSPLNRYYLSKLLRKADATQLHMPEMKYIKYISEGLDLLLIKLNSEQSILLEQLIRLHQEMSNQKSYYQDEIAQVEKQIFVLVQQPLTQRQTQIQACASRTRIGELLIRKKLLTLQQLACALSEQRVSQKRLGEILIKHKLITFDQLDELLQEQHSLSQPSDLDD